MDLERRLTDYWRCVAAQDREALRAFFRPDAVVRWHCTNERFTVEEFLTANCDYPGDWRGEVERFVQAGDTAVTAARVWTGGMSFHVSSFFLMEGGQIRALDEYWGDDGPPPQWRRDLALGTPIR